MPAKNHPHSDELELELRQVRSRAEVARLEARAAELELLLRQSARRADPLAPDPTLQQLPVNDWQELLAAAATLPPSGTPPAPPIPTTAPPAKTPPAKTPPAKTPTAKTPPAKTPAAKTPAAKTPAARAAATRTAPRKTALRPNPPNGGSSGAAKQPARGRAGRKPLAAAGSVSQRAATVEQVQRRKRPSAWIVSSIAHGGVLLVLAVTTVSVAEPVEQFTLDAAPPQASEEPIETVVLEQSAAPQEASQPSPADPVTELIPQATLLGGEIEIAPPEISAPSSFTALRPLLSASDESLSLEPTSGTTSEFFGAKGGGNHFVYLVDNSHSMTTVARDGFDVARRELLKSVDALSEEQRFYAIFFGEEVLRMRLADPAIPEPRSVYATAANKAALRRWAMGIAMQPGRWPEKALEFAFELRPDVIFLLTDGEMSQRAEPMIRQHNLVENLFEGPHPRSTIHTIGFYSRDGAEQMQQIARVNGGTYHFVPPPPR